MPSPREKYKAIFVLGPSSSGKTTLCNALAQSLGIPPARYIKEVARAVMRSHGFTRDDTDTFAMQHTIMSAQLQAERDAVASVLPVESDGDDETMGGLILSDRSAVDPIVYAGTSQAPGSEERRQKLANDGSFKDILPLYRESLFVVLEPVAEWFEDDGVRSMENPWRYNAELKKTLEELSIPYVTIGTEMKALCDRVERVRNLLVPSDIRL